MTLGELLSLDIGPLLVAAKFLAPAAPKRPTPLAVPRRSDAAVQTAVATQRSKFFGAEGGRPSTMLLTGSSGFSQGFSAGTAKLLGATSA